MRCCFQRAQQSRPDDSATASAAATGPAWQPDQSLKEPDQSTSALIESILPLFLPLACQIASQTLISQGCVQKNEIPITTFDENATIKELPIETIDVSIGDVFVVDRKTVKDDMEKDPDFNWPEKGRIDLLMKNIPGKKEKKLLVLDIVDFECFIQMGEGIEITFPSNIPLVGNLEIGSGGDIKKGSVKFNSGRLRVWFSNETKKCYIALMERPSLTPFLHVNADRGNGDYLTIYLKEDGSLDDIVETIMAGFGPKHKLGSKKDIEQKSSMSSTIGNALGKFVSNIVQNSYSSRGDNGPLEIDLSTQIKAATDVALGKRRTVEQIQADMEILQKELDLATQETKVDAKSSDSDPLELAIQETKVDAKSSDADPLKVNNVAIRAANVNDDAGNDSVSLKEYVVKSMTGVQNTLTSCTNPPIAGGAI